MFLGDMQSYIKGTSNNYTTDVYYFSLGAMHL